jgi:hypothetical protein
VKKNRSKRSRKTVLLIKVSSTKQFNIGVITAQFIEKLAQFSLQYASLSAVWVTTNQLFRVVHQRLVTLFISRNPAEIDTRIELNSCVIKKYIYKKSSETDAAVTRW